MKKTWKRHDQHHRACPSQNGKGTYNLRVYCSDSCSSKEDYKGNEAMLKISWRLIPCKRKYLCPARININRQAGYNVKGNGDPCYLHQPVRLPRNHWSIDNQLWCLVQEGEIPDEGCSAVDHEH